MKINIQQRVSYGAFPIEMQCIKTEELPLDVIGVSIEVLPPNYINTRRVIIEISNCIDEIIPTLALYKQLEFYDFYFGISSSGITNFGIQKHNPILSPDHGNLWSSNYIKASQITGIEQVDIIVKSSKYNAERSLNITIESLNKLLKPLLLVMVKKGYRWICKEITNIEF